MVLEREASFRRLADEHLEASYRLANVILGDPAESRDAVHDAFIRAWQSWPSLRDHSRFEWWFKRIVVNTCLHRLRHAARHRVRDITAEIGLASAGPSSPVHDRIVVGQALSRLRPDDRVILALRYHHDLRIADIAELLRVPIGTVKSRLNAAHARLRSVVGMPISEEQAS
jgi:RNA polymerase sigma-70 factor (ECF subfamily)